MRRSNNSKWNNHSSGKATIYDFLCGSGLFLLSGRKTLIGIFNGLEIRLETLDEAFALAAGESGEIMIGSGTFEAAPRSKVSILNELFVTPDKGPLPLFKGKITLHVKSFEATPDKPDRPRKQQSGPGAPAPMRTPPSASCDQKNLRPNCIELIFPSSPLHEPPQDHR